MRAARAAWSKGVLGTDLGVTRCRRSLYPLCFPYLLRPAGEVDNSFKQEEAQRQQCHLCNV